MLKISNLSLIRRLLFVAVLLSGNAIAQAASGPASITRMEQDSLSPKMVDLLKGNNLVLVDFWATWCGPCRAMHPVLETLKTEMGERVRIIKVDVDKNPDLVKELELKSVPTFMLYKNQQLRWRASGAFAKETLIKAIEDVEKQ